MQSAPCEGDFYERKENKKIANTSEKNFGRICGMKKKSHHRADMSPRFETNYALLNFLDKRGKSQTWLAELLGQTRPTVHFKTRNITTFTAVEIAKVRDALGLTPQEVCDLFLTFSPLPQG